MTDAWFERDKAGLRALEQTLRAKYPTLHAFMEDGVCRVRGGLEIVPGDRYAIDMALPSDYPDSPPRVWETDGRIPRETGRHTFPDGSLCLGTPLALWLALDGKFAVERVIDVPLRNFLVGNSLVEQDEPWPFEEQSHGVAGIVEHFGEVLGAHEPMALCKFLIDLAQGKVRGHWPCPCGSGVIIRKCHRDTIERLRGAPLGILGHAVDLILKDLKARRQLA
jgi:hypothetical protein